jgi:hypothetical protein
MLLLVAILVVTATCSTGRVIGKAVGNLEVLINYFGICKGNWELNHFKISRNPISHETQIYVYIYR